MQPYKITENVYWVGAIDWNLRNFHGYLTQSGSTYNSYLIIDKKITLIDTVKSCFADEMLSRVSKIIDPKKIDTIIVNHVEMDHSGSLPTLLGLCPSAEIYASSAGVQGLKEHFKSNWNFKTVKTGDILSLGEKTLKFIETKMIHWPDNMVSYLVDEKILFSNDAFGQHLASSERIDEEYEKDTIMREAKKYYANIVLPYSSQVQKAMQELSKYTFNTIAPSHGLIWKKNIKSIIQSYSEWMNNQAKEKAVVIYDTMWGSTEKIAMSLIELFETKRITTKLFNLQSIHISDIMTELIDAKFICIGSPTLNNNLLPSVSAFLTYMKGLSPKNRTGIAFGSYGWGGQSVGQIENVFQELNFNILPQIKIKYIPEKKDIDLFLEKIQNDIK